MDYTYDNIKKMLEQADRDEFIHQIKGINNSLKKINRKLSVVLLICAGIYCYKHKDTLLKNKFTEGE